MSQYKNNSSPKRAAALKYAPGKNKAPVVIASGSGYIADKVVEIAEESGIPVYKDDSLSSILSQLDAGTEIPEELFNAVVDIYVYFLNFKLPKSES